MARAALAGGADWLAVASISEAVEVRRSVAPTLSDGRAFDAAFPAGGSGGATWDELVKSAPMLCLSFVPPADAAFALVHNVSLTVFDEEQVTELAEAVRRARAERDMGTPADAVLRIHIKVDSGMGRVGVMPDGLAALHGTCLKYVEEGLFEVSLPRARARRATVVVRCCAATASPTH